MGSRQSSVSHLTQDMMSSCGSYTSLSFRSTPATNNGGHKHSRHSCHSHHRHHNHGQNNGTSHRKHQVYYQTHHALCKRASSSGTHVPNESVSHTNRRFSRNSHRRKSSSSSINESFRRRKHIDHESISFHGSGVSLFEPLHVDVSTPTTNTVILTPSKITIEHSNDYECKIKDKQPYASNGRHSIPNRNVYDLSPIRWSCGHNPDEVSITNDRTDFIEIISEPEELCRSHCTQNTSTGHNTNSKSKSKTKSTSKFRLNKYSAHGKKSDSNQYNNDHDDDDAFVGTNPYSAWETESNADVNNEHSTPHTIIFHHKSDLSDKNCCDNYCAQIYNNNDDDRNNIESLSDHDGNKSSQSPKTYGFNHQFHNNPMGYSIYSTAKLQDTDAFSNLTSNKNGCKSMSSLIQLDILNNAMQQPSSSSSSSTTATTIITSATNQLPNFQQNNISQFDTNRFLDLSWDMRRYSKITNFEQQNASNLLPNHLSRMSVGNLIESIATLSSGTLLNDANAIATTSTAANVQCWPTNQNFESNYFGDGKYGQASSSFGGGHSNFVLNSQQQQNYHQINHNAAPSQMVNSFELLTSNVRSSTSNESNATIPTIINDTSASQSSHSNIAIHSNNLTSTVNNNSVASIQHDRDERNENHRTSSRLNGLLKMLRKRTTRKKQK